MTFRDQLLVDRSVFVNAAEFGEELTIDGVSVVVVREDDTTAPGPGRVEGVFVGGLTLHLATGQLPRPVEGQRLTLGTGQTAEQWYVRHVGEAEGMLVVQLERNQT